MSYYKCSKCDKIVERNSKKKWITSYCEDTDNKARLILQKPLRVYLCDFNGESVRLTSRKDVLIWFESDLKEREKQADTGSPDYILSVEIEYMTKAEYAALPEF